MLHLCNVPTPPLRCRTIITLEHPRLCREVAALTRDERFPHQGVGERLLP
jgi:hypothetical protein